MKMLKLKLVYFLLAALIIGMYSCKSDSKKNNTEPVLEELGNEEENFEEQFFRFPSPEEIFGFLKETDLEFKEKIVNDAAKHKEYIDSKYQALNLGVYTSDLAYLTLFDENETFDYFEAVHNLTNNLQISAALTDELLNRVGDNLDNIDSLVIISNEAYKNIVDYLMANNKENTLALVSIGAYIESLYIGINLINDFEKDADMVQKIADQRFPFENLYNYANQKLKSRKEKEALMLLDEIKTIYGNLQVTESSEGTMQKKDDGKLVFGGGTKYNFTKESFSDFSKAVSDSRSKIVK